MALIKCKECGGAISKKAISCPKCGFPIKKETSMFTLILARAFAVIFIVVIFKGAVNQPRNSPPKATAPQPVKVVQSEDQKDAKRKERNAKILARHAAAELKEENCNKELSV